MSHDISTMYTKDKNMKSGRKGYFRWRDEKERAIRPCDYGDYILQRRKRGKKMINTVLDVDDVCQDCPYFSMETNHTTNYDGMHVIYISCERRDLCNYLRKHIGKGAKK